MHDDTASRKSGHRTAYEGYVGSPLPHKHKGKNEAGSPKQGEALISKILDSVELRVRKLSLRRYYRLHDTPAPLLQDNKSPSMTQINSWE